MSAKARLGILPIYDRFVLGDLLDTESLDPYNLPHELKPFVFRMRRTGLEAGRLSFLNPDFGYLPSAMTHLRVCGKISEVLVGMNECATTCSLRYTPPENDVPICDTCGAGILQSQSAVWVDGEIIGYVRGPERPSPEFYERDLNKLDSALRADLLEYRTALDAIDQERVARAVSRIARRLSRRCRLERRLKILRHTRKRIVNATTSAEVLESAFQGLQALFGNVDVCLYKLTERGEMALVNAKGPNDLFQLTVMKPGEGHVGAVIERQEQIYAADLLRDPKGFVQVNPHRPAQSAVILRMLWGSDQGRAALQVSSQEKDRFGKPERQAAWAIADMASLAGTRLDLLKARLGPRQW